jgi:regulator of extracellular matrix RemA (YlzA/DUF370 family)
MKDRRMTDNESKLEKILAGAFERDDQVPAFDATWAAAETRYRKRRRRRAMVSVAASVAIVAIVLSALQPETVDAPIIEMAELLGTTSWQAPSDVLLPEHRFDIYQDLPDLIQSTDGAGEALL